MDRRSFVAGMAGLWTGISQSRSPVPAAPRVEAEGTLFYAPPDAQRVLVRFHVHGTDAPAGRLRVYDSARSLLGTSGVLPVGDGDGHLYGELWVPLSREGRLVSELVLPGASPVWSFHTVRPGPRWVVHVLAIVDPAALLQRLDALPPMRQAVETAVLLRLPVRGNPAGASRPALLDHLPLLQLARAARLLEQRYGVRMSPIAAGPPTLFSGPTVALALNGSGARHVVVMGADGPPPVSSPDGSFVSVAPAGLVADMAALEMATGGAAMARATERWLQTLSPSPERTPGAESSAFVVSTSADAVSMLSVRAAEEWNARYAYPRIVLDGTPPPLEAFAASGGSAAAAVPLPTPSSATLAAAAAARLRERGRRAEAIVASLAEAMRIADHDLAGVAGRFAAAGPGTLVFNPAPFTRSDVARFPDGSERLVTDVPGNGYAFVPEIAGEAVGWRPAGVERAGQNHTFRIGLDPASGAIRSLVSGADGTEWVRPGGLFNEIGGGAGMIFEEQTLPGAARRWIVTRNPGNGSSLRSTITTYAGLPWVDIVNQTTDPGATLPDTSFALGFDASMVEWEVPAGSLDGIPPVDVAWLRWMRVSGQAGSLLLAGLETPLASVGDDGTIVTRAAGARAAYRLAVQPAGSERYREDPWRHGWSIEPFLTAAVPGYGRSTMPSFGSLIQTSDPGAIILGMEPQPDYSVIVYVQELLGFSRTVAVRSGIVRFSEARLSDLVGRDRAPFEVANGEVRFDLRARSVAAIKLLNPRVEAA